MKIERLGVESPSEKTRKMFSKLIKDEHLREFFKVTKERKQRTNLFMIAGLNTQEEWENFAGLLNVDYDGSPKIGIIVNYFDPQPLTPLERFDLRDIIEINLPRIKRLWKLKSARIVVYMETKIHPYNPLLNTMLCRANHYEVDSILELKKIGKFNTGTIKRQKTTGLPYFFEKVEQYGLTHLVDGTHKSEFKIEV